MTTVATDALVDIKDDLLVSFLEGLCRTYPDATQTADASVRMEVRHRPIGHPRMKFPRQKGEDQVPEKVSSFPDGDALPIAWPKAMSIKIGEGRLGAKAMAQGRSDQREIHGVVAHD